MMSPALARHAGVASTVDPLQQVPRLAPTADCEEQAMATAPSAAGKSSCTSPTAAPPPLLRVHDACATSELFGSLKCDCQVQLDAALGMVLAEGPPGGAVIYLQQEGRGIGLANKVAAYAVQQACGADTVDANRALGLPDDAREYGAVRDILADLGVPTVRLLTNNPRKVAQLELLGVDVALRVPLLVKPPSSLAQSYFDTKVARMQHLGE